MIVVERQNLSSARPKKRSNAQLRDNYVIAPFILSVWTIAVCLFVILPFAAILAVSLTPLDYISLPRGGLSVRWYAQILRHPEYLTATMTSVTVALEAAGLALLFGTLVALAFVRFKFVGREMVRQTATSPLFIPMVMSGLALLMYFSSHGWVGQLGRIVIGHTALTLPYVFRTMSSSLTGFDMNQEFAAQNLGAHPLKAFCLITLPQLGPGLTAAAIFAFIVSFDNVGLSIFLTGANYTTLPVQLLSYVENSNDPMSAAISVVMVLASMGIVVVTERLVGLQGLLRQG